MAADREREFEAALQSFSAAFAAAAVPPSLRGDWQKFSAALEAHRARTSSLVAELESTCADSA